MLYPRTSHESHCEGRWHCTMKQSGTQCRQWDQSSRFAATSFAHIAAGRPPTGTATSMQIIGAAFAGKGTWPGLVNIDGDSDDIHVSCN